MAGATLVDVPPVSPPVVSAFPTPKEQIEQAVAQLNAPKNSYQLIDEQDFKPGAWTVLTAEQRRESAITQAQNLRPGWGRTDIMSLFEPYRISRADKALLEKGTVYKNGKVEVQFYFGGTSLLIVVGVALDTFRQIEAHRQSLRYDAFLKKTTIRARGRRV